MKKFIATIAFALAAISFVFGPEFGAAHAQDAGAQKSEPPGEWVLVKPPLKPGKYTLRVDKYVEEDVGCEYEECGCWRTGSGCGGGEICVGVGICVPESSGIRGGREAPTYMRP